MTHLDTSFLIQSLVPQSIQETRMRFWLSTGAPLAVSAIAWAEFLCGPIDPSQVPLLERVVGKPLPFEESDTQRSADLFNAAGRRRGSLLDCMIAAVALREKATLATSDTAFTRFRSLGLQTEIL